MLVGRCFSKLSNHELQAKSKKSQAPSGAEGSAVPSFGHNEFVIPTAALRVDLRLNLSPSSPSLLIPYLSLTPPLVVGRSTMNTMEHTMQDLLMIVFAAVFFGVALLYVRGCDKLR